MKNKLPVVTIFTEAISLPFKHYRLLLKVGLPLIISGGLLITFFPENGKSELLTGLIVLIAIAFFVSLIMTIVGCHRLFLMDSSVVEQARPFNWTGNEIKYIGWWLLIGICTSLIALPFLFMLSLSSSQDNIFGNNAILSAVIYIPIYYVASRWSLVLPSSAIDRHGKSLTWSWRLSDGNGWRLTFLIGFLPFILDALLRLLPAYDSIIYSLFLGIVWLVVGVIEIGLLSLSYAFLASNESAVHQFQHTSVRKNT